MALLHCGPLRGLAPLARDDDRGPLGRQTAVDARLQLRPRCLRHRSSARRGLAAAVAPCHLELLLVELHIATDDDTAVHPDAEAAFALAVVAHEHALLRTRRQFVLMIRRHSHERVAPEHVEAAQVRLAPGEQLVRRLAVRLHHRHAVVDEDGRLDGELPECVRVELRVQEQRARHLHHSAVLALGDGVPLRRAHRRAGDLDAATLQHRLRAIVLLAAVRVEALHRSARLHLRPVQIRDDVVRRPLVDHHQAAQMATEHVRHHGQVELGALCAAVARRHRHADGTHHVGDHHIVGRLRCVVDLLTECAALHLGQHAGVAVGDQQFVGRMLVRHDQTVRRLVLDQLVDLAPTQMAVLRVRQQRGGRDACHSGCTSTRRLSRHGLADLARLHRHRRHVLLPAVAVLCLRVVLRHGHRSRGGVGLRRRLRQLRVADLEGDDEVVHTERNGERLRAVDEQAVVRVETQPVAVLDELDQTQQRIAQLLAQHHVRHDQHCATADGDVAVAVQGCHRRLAECTLDLHRLRKKTQVAQELTTRRHVDGRR